MTFWFNTGCVTAVMTIPTLHILCLFLLTTASISLQIHKYKKKGRKYWIYTWTDRLYDKKPYPEGQHNTQGNKFRTWSEHLGGILHVDASDLIIKHQICHICDLDWYILGATLTISCLFVSAVDTVVIKTVSSYSFEFHLNLNPVIKHESKVTKYGKGWFNT